jgi:hypothetical protein
VADLLLVLPGDPGGTADRRAHDRSRLGERWGEVLEGGEDVAVVAAEADEDQGAAAVLAAQWLVLPATSRTRPAPPRGPR